MDPSDAASGPSCAANNTDDTQDEDATGFADDEADEDAAPTEGGDDSTGQGDESLATDSDSDSTDADADAPARDDDGCSSGGTTGTFPLATSLFLVWSFGYGLRRRDQTT